MPKLVPSFDYAFANYIIFEYCITVTITWPLKTARNCSFWHFLICKIDCYGPNIDKMLISKYLRKTGTWLPCTTRGPSFRFCRP